MNKVNKQGDQRSPNWKEVSLKVNLKNGFLNLEPGEIVEAGNIMLLKDNRIVSYPVVIGNPVFVEDATYNSSSTQEGTGTAEGILMISDLIIELDDLQEIIQYGEKPRVLLHVGGVMQFIMQPTTYLLGKTKINIEWEFTTRPVPLRTILRVG